MDHYVHRELIPYLDLPIQGQIGHIQFLFRHNLQHFATSIKTLNPHVLYPIHVTQILQSPIVIRVDVMRFLEIVSSFVHLAKSSVY